MKNRVTASGGRLRGGMCVAAAVVGVVGVECAWGASTPGKLAVMVLGVNGASDQSATVAVGEFSRTGTGQSAQNLTLFPRTGATAITVAIPGSHEPHLHRSVDNRLLTFGAYGAEPFKEYPQSTTVVIDGVEYTITSTLTSPIPSDAVAVPRVGAVLRFDGTMDLSTRTVNAYDQTSVRAVATVDGTGLWFGGDNRFDSGASVPTFSGGTRYAPSGGTTTVNLSQNQNPSLVPDNIRDVAIYGGRLFVTSGSSASIGKAVFAVGSGVGPVPTSGAQAPTPISLNAAGTGIEAISISSLVGVDADPDVAGMDTIYAISASSTGIRRYGKGADGAWRLTGFRPTPNTLPEFEHITAVQDADGSVAVYVSNLTSLLTLRDTTPRGTALTTTGYTTLATAPQNTYFGGVDFAPFAFRSLRWTGAGNGQWTTDAGQTPWTDAVAPGGATEYRQGAAMSMGRGDAVAFGTAASPLGGASVVSVPVAGVTPDAVGANVAAGGSVRVQGGFIGGTGTITKAGAGTLTLATRVYSPAPILVQGGTLAVAGRVVGTSEVNVSAGATFEVTAEAVAGAAVRTTVLTVNGTVRVAGTGPAKVIVADTVSIANSGGTYTGLIELGRGDLIDRNGDAAAMAASLAGLRAAARVGFEAAGTAPVAGLGSSAGGASTAVAVVGNLVRAGVARFETYDGVGLGAFDVIARFTYRGDTNLDGVLNGQDLVAIIEGITTGLTGWENGDVNYDGVVNGVDLGLFNAALGNQTLGALGNGSAEEGGPSGAVPEPGGVVVGAGVAGLLGGRRRR